MNQSSCAYTPVTQGTRTFALSFCSSSRSCGGGLGVGRGVHCCPFLLDVCGLQTSAWECRGLSFVFFSFCAVVSLCQCRRHSSPCRVTRMCKVDPSVVVSYHRERGEGEGFKLKEGFALIVAATGGFLFLSFAVCISNCASRPSPKYRPSQATIPQ